MIFVSLIMINGRWVKRQKRMHEHINLHCRTLADFVEFRREKNTQKTPCAAVCCWLSNRLPDSPFSVVFSRMQTNDLDAECIRSKRKINNVTIELPIGVRAIRRFWFLFIQILLATSCGSAEISISLCRTSRSMQWQRRSQRQQHYASFRIMQTATTEQ